MTIKNLVVTIVKSQSAIQRELDSFAKEMSGSSFNIREVTKSAFTQARAKLNPWAFKRLNDVAVKSFYSEANFMGWNGMRVLAVDGTRMMLPNHPSITEEFGLPTPGPGQEVVRPLAMGSLLYDVLNQITIDAEIAPYSWSEQDLLLDHLEKVEPGDLLLLDRGYPSHWLFFLLMAKQIHFCIRVPEKWSSIVKDFSQSKLQEQIVQFTLPKKDRKCLADFPHMQDQTINCRLIKFPLEDGKVEILCTSLIDCEKYPIEDFEDLYHLRWNVEEAYKLLKNRIGLEGFTGKTATAVRQDFFAKVFLMTLSAAFAHPIEEKVRAEYKADQKRKHDQKINRTQALAMTREIMIATFIKKQFTAALDAFDKVVASTREIIRPGRKTTRRPNQTRKYSINYKNL